MFSFNQMSHTTPVIGKLPAPALGRFLTPTQSSNITPNCMATQNKKITQSASKASGFPKTTTTTTKGTLSRENSGDDFRKGLHQMAEERKKQREMKHMQAAQLREQKEKERAERLAKANKEREEKRLLKAESEQKKRELEEIRRKLKQQEEAEAAAKKKQLAAKQKAILEQERELLKAKEASKTRMLPPPPKVQAKYTFEMLHEDDSTDDEAKTSYKRPPPPTWSRSKYYFFLLCLHKFKLNALIFCFTVQNMFVDLPYRCNNINQLVLLTAYFLFNQPHRILKSYSLILMHVI